MGHEYRLEGPYLFFLSFFLISVLSKLKRTLEKHKQTRLRSETYRQLLFYLDFRSLVSWSYYPYFLLCFLLSTSLINISSQDHFLTAKEAPKQLKQQTKAPGRHKSIDDVTVTTNPIYNQLVLLSRFAIHARSTRDANFVKIITSIHSRGTDSKRKNT